MKTNQYDIIFLGIGISTIIEIIKNRSSYEGKNILFISKDKSFNREKTICGFHEEDKLSLVKKFYQFSAKTESDNYSFKTRVPYSILDLDKNFKEFEKITQGAKFLWNLEVKNIQKLGNTFRVTSAESEYECNVIYDSRPPCLKNKHFLKQHFLGHFYRFDGNHGFKNPVIMDINESPDDFHFFYLIPLDEKNLLVETTHFGREELHQSKYVHEINSYMEKNFKSKNYNLTDVESGVIPMIEIIPRFKEKNYHALGIRSGALRASTGYSAFQNLFRHKKGVILKKMDEILLRILWRNSSIGNLIFHRFFRSLNGDRISNFLGPSPSITTLFSVIYKMPKRPFLKEVFSRRPKFNHSLVLRSMND